MIDMLKQELGSLDPRYRFNKDELLCAIFAGNYLMAEIRVKKSDCFITKTILESFDYCDSLEEEEDDENEDGDCGFAGI
jgi:hypothetical protein